MASLPSSALAAGADDSWSGRARGVGAATWHQPLEGADAALKEPVPQRKPWTRITCIHNKEEASDGEHCTMENGARTRGVQRCPNLVPKTGWRAYTPQPPGDTNTLRRVLLHTLHFYMECELGVYGSRCSWGVGPSKTPFWLAVVAAESSVQHVSRRRRRSVRCRLDDQ
jgi:hypothetical protein